MKLLALDSSSIVATAALIDEDKIIGEMIVNHKKNHSQKLMPLIQQLLNETEVNIQEVDAFGVCIGPGSFTGIRIGLSTAKALAQVGNKPLVGISTLEGLAFNLPYSRGIICPILDAQREQIYTGLYKWEGNQMFSIVEDHAIAVEDWIEELRKRAETIHLIGDGIPKFASTFKERLGEKVSIAPITARMPRASSIANLALQKVIGGEANDYKSVVPHYIRKSQAEQKFGV
jgi:tRNA threonylcarbamoyladenosine biosynthesis protein TsaB